MTRVGPYFSDRAANYCEGNWQGRRLFMPEERAIAAIPSEALVALDIGSGPGRPIPFLQGRVKQVIGVDLSTAMLSLRTHTAPVIIADGLALPAYDRSVDVCYMRMSLHYFDLAALVRELARVIKVGGRAIIVSILPYGEFDEVWFNDRHRLKGKTAAWTPPLSKILRATSAHFQLLSAELWTEASSLNRTLKSNTAGDFHALRDHALSAPIDVRQAYRIHRSADGDVRSVVQWAVLVLTRAEYNGAVR